MPATMWGYCLPRLFPWQYNMNAPNSTHVWSLGTLGTASHVHATRMLPPPATGSALTAMEILKGVLGNPGDGSLVDCRTQLQSTTATTGNSVFFTCTSFKLCLASSTTLQKPPTHNNHQRPCRKQAMRPRQSWAQLQAHSTEQRGGVGFFWWLNPVR